MAAYYEDQQEYEAEIIKESKTLDGFMLTFPEYGNTQVSRSCPGHLLTVSPAIYSLFPSHLLAPAIYIQVSCPSHLFTP
jgi:hypothetical protein